ncbi:MAG: FKBP-type peptidyl-prolyl cis-trans isomerase FklB [Bacteroidia bacterium]|jgi:FKBP-type peptidyl-prolyl cis-trans isomerase FklB
MKKTILIAVVAAFVVLTSMKLTSNKTMQGQTEIDALSYALGVNVGNNLKSSGFESVNSDEFIKGLKESLAGEVSEQTLASTNAAIQNYMQEKEAEKAKDLAKVGEKYLADNASKEDVVTMPSGLQYKVITVGTGPKPVDGDNVTTHYTGKFVDGKVFDSSVSRGEPATFGVNQVIKGWTEALKLMPEGSKWELYIPYDLAYGAQGRPPQIPEYSMLIFEIELIKVVGK